MKLAQFFSPPRQYPIGSMMLMLTPEQVELWMRGVE